MHKWVIWFSISSFMPTDNYHKKSKLNIEIINTYKFLKMDQKYHRCMNFWGIQITEELWNQFCSSKRFWG